MLWHTAKDEYGFKINIDLEKSVNTKRELLSQIASLFDPLGWIAPVLIKPKLLLQQLWQLKVDWDEKLPSSIQEEWQKIKNELPLITKLRIPRWIGTTKSSKVELHSFGDASEAAIAAVVYLRSFDENGEIINVSLLTAKTKVAPIKKLTIPRLELCAAVLTARLTKQVISALNMNIERVYLYSDSKIVLGWLNGSPNKWKTFVANKVTKIVSNTNKNDWYHVKSGDNPADCASRGLYPSEINNELWWSGPQWLKTNELKCEQPSEFHTELEMKKIVLSANVTVLNEFLPAASSFYKLKRIIAYCCRFIHNCKNKNKKMDKSQSRN